jgi:hypothetical protein
MALFETKIYGNSGFAGLFTFWCGYKNRLKTWVLLMPGLLFLLSSFLVIHLLDYYQIVYCVAFGISMLIWALPFLVMSFADDRKEAFENFYISFSVIGVALAFIAGTASFLPCYETTSGVVVKVHVEKLEDRIVVTGEGVRKTSYFISDYVKKNPLLCYTNKENGFKVPYQEWRICDGN